MNWLSLSFGQVAAFSAVASAVALWLYLRRSKAIRLRVSTLRFWTNVPSGASTAPRWKLREPWAFAAQILFLLLIVAALGNPRWGVTQPGRDVAIVIDAGAWSQSRPAGSASQFDAIRTEALNFLSQLPLSDRVLLLRADAEGAPILPFTTDRNSLRFAIQNLQPSSAVADIPKALSQARAALGSQRRGVLAYIGPGRVDDKQARALDEFRGALAAPPPASGGQGTPPQFLVRILGDPYPLHNRGITDVSLKRTSSGSDEWTLVTRLKNYDAVASNIVLSLSVGGHIFKQDRVLLAPGATANQSDDFTSRSGGLLQAEINPGDELDADNRATIQLPSSEPVSVAVVTSRPRFAEKMRSVLAADPYVKAQFVSSGSAVPSSADVVVYDGDLPPGPAKQVISFAHPAADSPARRVRLGNWNSAHPVTRWIQSRDVSVRAARSLQVEPGDVVLASIANAPAEPLLLAREANGRRSVLADFDPTDSNFTDEPAFPLLMAASIEWMTRTVGEQSDALFTGPIELPQPISRITAPSGRDVFFAAADSKVHFFAAESGLYRADAAGQIVNLPVNVHLLPSALLVPTSAETAAVEAEPATQEHADLWRWLVALALVPLWLEWWFFYKRRTGDIAGRQTKRGGRHAAPETSVPAARAS